MTALASSRLASDPNRSEARTEMRWLVLPPVLFLAFMLAGPAVALIGVVLAGEIDTVVASLTSSAFIASTGRTLLLAVICSVACVAIAVPYALAIGAGPLWLRWFLLGGVLLSLWTSIMARTFGWMLLELPIGAIHWFLDLVGISSEPLSIYQTAFGMYPPMIGVMLPFAVLAIQGSVLAIDKEQLSAASTSGAGPWLILRAIVLPTIRSSMISGGVLVFVISVGFYVTPLLLGGPSNLTLSGIINAQLKTAGRVDVGAAMSILLLAGTIAVYLVTDRLFRVSERMGLR